MSTDYDIACMRCRKIHHLGQFMAGRYSFGHGTNDAEGQADVFKFILDHMACRALVIDDCEHPDFDELTEPE